jgi:hypothetical protein
VVKNFISYYKKGMLPLGEPFSVYYKTHLDQTLMLFDLFFYANDFNTLYKVRDASQHLARDNTATPPER